MPTLQLRVKLIFPTATPFESATNIVLFSVSLQSFKTFYLCVDALDECSDWHRRDFIKSIATLLGRFQNSARLFVTGRSNVKDLIEQSFATLPRTMAVEAHGDDIRKYLSRQMDMDENQGDMADSFKRQVVDTIAHNADRMFLPPALQIQAVLEQTSIAKRKMALKSLPAKLDGAFKNTIGRICSQSSTKSNQGMEVLKWTYLAKRPLTVIELRHTLAVSSSPTDSLDLDSLPFGETLTTSCYGLVVIDKETSTVRLVHKSLQDFLKSQNDSKQFFQTGHRDIAWTCLLYLSYNNDMIGRDPMTVKGRFKDWRDDFDKKSYYNTSTTDPVQDMATIQYLSNYK
ncbi:hypothetical protein FPQ18DRAFT_301284 [Pyronema domesticum]|nr:hypothetical protein FPQ18DRAFT_301284 [Pyronema domesticum]